MTEQRVYETCSGDGWQCDHEAPATEGGMAQDVGVIDADGNPVAFELTIDDKDVLEESDEDE